MGNFKWNNRKKATETAIKLKLEKGLSPEEAVKKVMKDYEGVYFVNGSEISEKRYQNFIERVDKEKKYKSGSKNEEKKETHEFAQAKIGELVDKGEITEFQATLLDAVFNSLASYEVGTSDITLDDISTETGIKTPRLKGALGHLIKKGYLRTEEIKKEDETLTCIFIEEDKYGLYNEDVKAYHANLEKDSDSEEVTDEEIEDAISELKEIHNKA